MSISTSRNLKHTTEKIDIIGAGIGGLTTAIALKEKGFEVTLFEQAQEIKPVGAGIILANNAMQVLNGLGLRASIEKAGNPISSMKITRANLKVISTIDLKYFENKFGVRNIAIHRGALQQILANRLNASEIVFDRVLEQAVREEKGYTLNFKGGHKHAASILLGADGINSVVRENLFGKTTLRSAHQVCWRGMTNYALPERFENEAIEAWGQGDRFGFVRISPDKVYWYALKSFVRTKDECPVDGIEKYFQNYHDMIRAIIHSTPKEDIHTTTIADLRPIKKWYDQSACLIGDAAHATTPNMGQGACQAIEDAYYLSECMSRYEISTALEEFQKMRMDKVQLVVKGSWFLGKISHWSNPALVGLRNWMMQCTPSFIQRAQSESIFRLKRI